MRRRGGRKGKSEKKKEKEMKTKKNGKKWEEENVVTNEKCLKLAADKYIQ